jgi:hypothetical protein
MHHALCIPEIQFLITQFSLNYDTLLSLARSGKIWTEVALDALYGQHDLSLSKALYPLHPTTLNTSERYFPVRTDSSI